MNLSSNLEREDLVLIHAPIGRDAPLLHELLHRAKLRSLVCLTIEAVCREIERDAGALFIADEALEDGAIERLATALKKQGSWSDLPLILLTVGGEPTMAARLRLSRLEPLGYVTLLERPLRSDTIISAAQTALRARARQYEIRRRDAELQLITDKVPVLISYIDRQQIYRRVNATYFDWLGKRPDEIVGKTIQAVAGEAHFSSAQPYVARVLAGEPVSFESRIRNQRHELRDIAVSYAPDVAQDGDVRGFVALVQDITERKRAERRNAFLIELDATLRPLTDPVEITQMAAKLLAEHLDVNRCAYADVEEDEDTFNLTGDFNRGVPSIAGRYTFLQFGAECLRLMREGKPYVVEDSESDARTTGVRDAYRSTLIRSVICVSLRKQERFVAAMAVHQSSPRTWRADEVDIVQQVASRCWESIERARVLRELRESEQELRIALDTARLGSWHLDLKTWELSSSRQCHANFGVPENESFTYERLLSLIHPEDLPRMQEAVETAIRSRVDYNAEYRIIRPDGTPGWIVASGRAIYGSDGAPGHIVGVTLDVSERKLAEEAIKRSNQELKRANRELEEFAYVSSHDLQEPLRMVNSYSQLLIRRLGPLADDELRKFSDYIRTGVRRMEALITDLLAYSRTSHSDEGTVYEHADLNASLEQALSRVDTRIQENQAQVTSDALPVVIADERQLSHVFQNLLTNALKYRKRDESPRIHIGAQRQNGLWIVSVSDNGIGFNPIHSERIFGLFKRLHRDDEYPGTGLGLAICKRIIERYHGHMWAESREGVGSTFYIALPEVEDEQTALHFPR